MACQSLFLFFAEKKLLNKPIYLNTLAHIASKKDAPNSEIKKRLV